MEVAWEALEDAGIDPSSIKGKNVGVFVGISDSEPPPTLAGVGGVPTAFHSTGNAKCM